MNPIASGPSPDVLIAIGRACDDGKYVSAYGLTDPLTPFEAWPDANALCVGARLVQHLGGFERSRRLALRAYRRDPTSAEARYWVGNRWLEDRGPLATLDWLEGYEPPAGTTTHSYASWCWLLTFVWSAFRDFDRAEEWLKRAEEVEPKDAYGRAVRVAWLRAQDRYDEALELARSGLKERPFHQPSVRALADLLTLHARYDEALSVLEEAAGSLESGALLLTMAGIQQEIGLYRESLEALERGSRMLPLLEQGGQQRLAALRSDAFYFSGDDASALREAKRAESPFFAGLAKRLESVREGKRVMLDVGFVRQHQLTCVPATLTTLGRFWKVEVDHLEIAERICYDGTPSHSERVWFRDNGWSIREFTTSWDGVRALIDRGVPLIVTTVQATAAHAQAIVGYDERRGTLFIRDPYVPSKIEAVAEAFLESYRAHGPRGLAPVPSDRVGVLDELEELELPDGEVYALMARLEAALEAHDRAGARACATKLAECAPEHRLNLSARRALAAYDANPFEAQRAAEDALVKFPGEPTWLLTLIHALRSTSTPKEVRARLEEICRDPEAHPVFHETLAAELLDDDRELEGAMRTLRRVARGVPDRAQTIGHLARCHWNRREFTRALSLFRLAACMEPTNENWSRAYFRAAFALGQTEPALLFLKRRASVFLRRAAAPSTSLFHALETLDRTPEAFEVLATAIEARPDDGALLSVAADAHARYGEMEKAQTCLERARSCISRTAWARSAAAIASLAGEHERAIELLEEVVEAEPLSREAHAELARHLAAARGTGEAQKHVRAASERFPENAELLELHAEWLKGEQPARVMVELRKLIALEPSNAWAHRELALQLAEAGSLVEARAACEQALAIAPGHVAGQLVLARLYESEGNREAARTAYRAALGIDPDCGFAIRNLLGAARNREESLTTLSFVESLLSQSVTGESIGSWFEAATRHLPAEELLERLLALRARREDLWTTWLCLARHLRLMGESERALEAAESATRRFPLLPAAWLELGRCHGTHRLAESIEALERAVTIGSSFTNAYLALQNALGRNGAEDLGLSALERGLALNPTDQQLLLAHADVLWHLRRRDDAIASLQRAIALEPSNGDSWQRLADWDAADDFDAASLVRTFAEQRPWDVAIWMRVAESEAVAHPERALQTLDRVLGLDPMHIDAHDLRAFCATKLGHKAMAIQACAPKQFVERPVSLRGREAWVIAEFGDFNGAIAHMRRVLADHPDYLFGWSRIADWAEHGNDHATALEAATALARLEPTSAVAHGYLGDALARAEQREKALEVLRHSLDLDPTYDYGLHRYLNLLLTDSRLVDHGESVLEHVRRHAAPASVAFFRMRFALIRGDKKAVRRWAAEIFSDPDVSEEQIETTRTLLATYDAYLPAKILIKVAMSERGSPDVAAAWARAVIDSGSLPTRSALGRLRAIDEERAIAAFVVLINFLGETRQMVQLASRVVRNPGFVRNDDRLWASVGYALTSASYHLVAILWLWGYERRAVQPWVLLNLAAAFRNRGFRQSALRVHHEALRLPPDQTRSSHALFIALDACLDGNVEQARLLASEVAEDKLPVYYDRVHTVVTHMIQLDEAEGAGERAERTRAAFGAVTPLYATPIRSALELSAIQWRRVRRRIGRSSGTFGGLVLGYWDSVLALVAWAGVVWLVVETGGWIIPVWYLVVFGFRVMTQGATDGRRLYAGDE